MKRFPLTLIAACILALNGTAWAAGSATDSYLKRATPRFESFAGSSSNLSSLAGGLRSGTPITLTGSGEKVAFNAPTKPMGYGNVTRSLDLAQRQLAAQGITNPTPTQLQTALMGGTIVGPKGSVTYTGVLQQRASGMGWGQIAHANSLHPGMGKSASSAKVSASSSRINSAAGRGATTTVKTSRAETHSAAVQASGPSGRGLGHSPAMNSAAGGHMGGASGGMGGMGGGHGGGRGK